jgi:hypothetical protein
MGGGKVEIQTQDFALFHRPDSLRRKEKTRPFTQIT